METQREHIFKSIRSLGMKVLPSDANLILFGSQARNDTHEESDWNLLILINDNQTSQDTFSTYAYPFVELGWDFGTYFSPKIYTRTEWSKRKGTPFYENIEKEGVVLC